jgi:adenosylmethionine-8-amino-7-oxononanoate aminotransferase
VKPTARQKQLLKRTFIDFKQTSEVVEAPLIFEKAEGLYCWDVTGKRYFDAISGIWTAVLGHRHPRVMEAMRRQMEKMMFVAPLHGISDVTLDFVEKLGSVTPGNLKYVKAFSGGSEAVEAAMKFARQYFKQAGEPGKYKFVSLYQGYHGGTLAALSAGGGRERRAKFEPLMAGYVKVFSPMQLRDHFASWEETNRFCAGLFEEVIASEGPETIAGVIVEPVGVTGGIAPLTAEFLQILRDTCDRHDVLLIYDEIVTGFARTGEMFAAQTFGVTPDIICAGKAVTSGAVPIGAMVAREDMADAFWGPVEDHVQFAHGHTYAGNPLACAAGIAVIDEILERELAKKARRLGRYLAAKLEGLKRYGVVREVRGRGMLLGVELVKDTATMEPFPPGNKLGDALTKTAVKNGLILRVTPDWFAVAPPLIAEEADMDEMCALIDQSLRDALNMLN